jgi:hypothetical protein
MAVSGEGKGGLAIFQSVAKTIVAEMGVDGPGKLLWVIACIPACFVSAA